ncbi:CCR4-NOT transcription complex subunit 1, putative [Plasmodium berghei]|uniref:CCR4-NOT transcription complex subunit 1, putative n=2 Tax=Plasmodium berghei TaxID=5821 RepID=A0A509AIX9_PLABA|nr:CCR4-NOT transcription complex subunit 1, putative [Plasmodium berghei ANKA]CXI46907.1 CCR4-NOT transcription complex subunit 1, putative [Plasmodium berghei]SCM22841.1 CCR4-NOT transcription complex subunit 1, putative [Plasmodium berghei]VUC55973.1 CCR4-NOT transcription complex subunit 1, putative [Plasmodium berghei ANKA]|eukprot:XP_034421783.1 CCR4-NOT transcription complex subunit 1, putative [Plasmodium berghei ANKA]
MNNNFNINLQIEDGITNKYEAEVNGYFAKLYTGEITVNTMIDIMKNLSCSPKGSKNNDIYKSMLLILFNECKFFPKYPVEELDITAQLFGKLIKHNLLISYGNTLSVVLKCILEALKKGSDSKVFNFGITALEQFEDSLICYPAFLSSLIPLPTLRQYNPQYIIHCSELLNTLPEQFRTLPYIDASTILKIKHISEISSYNNISNANISHIPNNDIKKISVTNANNLKNINNLVPHLTTMDGSNQTTTNFITHNNLSDNNIENSVNNNIISEKHNDNNTVNTINNSNRTDNYISNNNQTQFTNLMNNILNQNNNNNFNNINNDNMLLYINNILPNLSNIVDKNTIPPNINNLQAINRNNPLYKNKNPNTNLNAISGINNINNLNSAYNINLLDNNTSANILSAKSNRVYQNKGFINTNEPSHINRDINLVTNNMTQNKNLSSTNLLNNTNQIRMDINIPSGGNNFQNIPINSNIIRKDNNKNENNYTSGIPHSNNKDNVEQINGCIEVFYNQVQLKLPSNLNSKNIIGFGLGQIECLMDNTHISKSIIIPSSVIVGEIFSIFNTLCLLNIDEKIKILKDVMQPEYYSWLAFYIVKSRVSKEVNLHNVFLEFIDKLSYPMLIETIINMTYDYILILFKYINELKEVSAFRTVLKNLGSWLGFITLGRNKPLKSKILDLKLVLFEAYDKDCLVCILPMVCKILESIKLSKSFKPPNPWTTTMLCLLTEIHELPNAKTYIIFEVEVLFKNLSLNIQDYQNKTVLLSRRPPQHNQKNDFNIVDSNNTNSPLLSTNIDIKLHSLKPNIPNFISTNDNNTNSINNVNNNYYNITNWNNANSGIEPNNISENALLEEFENLTKKNNQNNRIINQDKPDYINKNNNQQLLNLKNIISHWNEYNANKNNPLQNDQILVSSFPPPDIKSNNSTTFNKVFDSISKAYNSINEQTLNKIDPNIINNYSIPNSSINANISATSNDHNKMNNSKFFQNLCNATIISPSIALFQIQPNLKKVVPIAVDRSIKEIISAVLERSVTISCITTREIISKDFCLEKDQNIIRKASHIMTASLAASLALATCKEPLRISLTQNLRELLQPTSTKDCNDQVLIEQVVQVLSADNLELGCNLIEQAVIEKAITDINEALAPTLLAKHITNENNKKLNDSVNIMNSKKMQIEFAEILNLGVPITNNQLQIYKDFLNMNPLKKLYSSPKPLTLIYKNADETNSINTQQNDQQSSIITNENTKNDIIPNLGTNINIDYNNINNNLELNPNESNIKIPQQNKPLNTSAISSNLNLNKVLKKLELATNQLKETIKDILMLPPILFNINKKKIIGNINKISLYILYSLSVDDNLFNLIKSIPEIASLTHHKNETIISYTNRICKFLFEIALHNYNKSQQESKLNDMTGIYMEVFLCILEKLKIKCPIAKEHISTCVIKTTMSLLNAPINNTITSNNNNNNKTEEDNVNNIKDSEKNNSLNSMISEISENTPNQKANELNIDNNKTSNNYEQFYKSNANIIAGLIRYNLIDIDQYKIFLENQLANKINNNNAIKFIIFLLKNILIDFHIYRYNYFKNIFDHLNNIIITNSKENIINEPSKINKDIKINNIIDVNANIFYNNNDNPIDIISAINELTKEAKHIQEKTNSVIFSDYFELCDEFSKTDDETEKEDPEPADSPNDDANKTFIKLKVEKVETNSNNPDIESQLNPEVSPKHGETKLENKNKKSKKNKEEQKDDSTTIAKTELNEISLPLSKSKDIPNKNSDLINKKNTENITEKIITDENGINKIEKNKEHINDKNGDIKKNEKKNYKKYLQILMNPQNLTTLTQIIDFCLNKDWNIIQTKKYNDGIRDKGVGGVRIVPKPQKVPKQQQHIISSIFMEWVKLSNIKNIDNPNQIYVKFFQKISSQGLLQINNSDNFFTTCIYKAIEKAELFLDPYSEDFESFQNGESKELFTHVSTNLTNSNYLKANDNNDTKGIESETELPSDLLSKQGAQNENLKREYNENDSNVDKKNQKKTNLIEEETENPSHSKEKDKKKKKKKNEYTDAKSKPTEETEIDKNKDQYNEKQNNETNKYCEDSEDNLTDAVSTNLTFNSNISNYEYSFSDDDNSHYFVNNSDRNSSNANKMKNKKKDTLNFVYSSINKSMTNDSTLNSDKDLEKSKLYSEVLKESCVITDPNKDKADGNNTTKITKNETNNTNLEKEKKRKSESNNQNNLNAKIETQIDDDTKKDLEKRTQITNILDTSSIDALAKMIVSMMKLVDSQKITPYLLLQKVMNIFCRILVYECRKKKNKFNQRSYFRLFLSILIEISKNEKKLESYNKCILALGYYLRILNPLRVPMFVFAWVELISHKLFLPKILQTSKGWYIYNKLIIYLFEFLYGFLKNSYLTQPIKLLYRATLRILLLLLHDFPEFLCVYSFSFCNSIPLNCMQLRNIILSALPRNTKLPNPFNPNLKINLLPEIKTAPVILNNFTFILIDYKIKKNVDEYFITKNLNHLKKIHKKILIKNKVKSFYLKSKYNIPLLNALVLYIGMSLSPEILFFQKNPELHQHPALEIILYLIYKLDMEGKYYLLASITNHLRYPNSHTHFFSSLLLWIFNISKTETIKEQVTGILLERLIVNKPHPWGLLVTFMQLIKNPIFNFWNCSFVRVSPEIETLFNTIANSCMPNKTQNHTTTHNSNNNESNGSNTNNINKANNMTNKPNDSNTSAYQYNLKHEHFPNSEFNKYLSNISNSIQNNKQPILDENKDKIKEFCNNININQLMQNSNEKININNTDLIRKILNSENANFKNHITTNGAATIPHINSIHQYDINSHTNDITNNINPKQNIINNIHTYNINSSNNNNLSNMPFYRDITNLSGTKTNNNSHNNIELSQENQLINNSYYFHDKNIMLDSHLQNNLNQIKRNTRLNTSQIHENNENDSNNIQKHFNFEANNKLTDQNNRDFLNSNHFYDSKPDYYN